MKMKWSKLVYIMMALILIFSAIAAVPFCASSPEATMMDASSVFVSGPEIDGVVSVSE